MQTKILTSHEVASLVQVSPSAVLRWIDGGLLPAFRTPGGHRRVGVSELVGFLRSRSMPVPKQLAGPRLLVIDDQPAFLTSLAGVLERSDAGFQVELAQSAVDGLIKIGLQRPDAVLLDAYMPGIDGLEVCRRIKSQPETAHIAVVAMSGRRTDELVQHFEAAGAATFLEKPFDTAALIRALSAVGLMATPQPQP